MMDIIDNSFKSIQKQLEELDNLIQTQKANQQDDYDYNQTQSILDVITSDKDKNLDRILDQQAHLKMIIERDGRIISLNKQIVQDNVTIESLRKSCAQLEQKALRERQELLDAQAKELERFQLQQLKSISEDYRRHQEILEQRKKEISNLKKEIENEENNRDAFLASYEKDCERTLNNRRQIKLSLATGLSAASNNVTNEIRDPEHLELESVDEYAPYGPAPHSRVTNVNSTSSTTSKRGGSARGRRARGRGATK